MLFLECSLDCSFDFGPVWVSGTRLFGQCCFGPSQNLTSSHSPAPSTDLPTPQPLGPACWICASRMDSLDFLHVLATLWFSWKTQLWQWPHAPKIISPEENPPIPLPHPVSQKSPAASMMSPYLWVGHKIPNVSSTRKLFWPSFLSSCCLNTWAWLFQP